MLCRKNFLHIIVHTLISEKATSFNKHLLTMALENVHLDVLHGSTISVSESGALIGRGFDK